MHTTKLLKPEDIFPTGVDTAIVNGKTVRKGTIAAFIANADILENDAASHQEKEDALKTIQELAPAVFATGLHKHVTYKNPVIQAILMKAE